MTALFYHTSLLGVFPTQNIAELTKCGSDSASNNCFANKSLFQNLFSPKTLFQSSTLLDCDKLKFFGNDISAFHKAFNVPFHIQMYKCFFV